MDRNQFRTAKKGSQVKQPPAKPSSTPRHSSSTTTTTSNKKKQQDLKPRQTTSTSTWACLVCTFENSLSSSNCEMCNTARPYANGNGVSEHKKATTTPKKKTTKQQHIVSTPSPSSTSIWTCNACTFENDNSAEECTMCTSPRPFSSSSQFPSPSSVMQQAAEEEEDYDEAYDDDTNLDVVDTPIHNKAKRTECVNWGAELYDLEELLSNISPTDQKERQKILARIQKAEKKYEEISGEKVGLLRNHMRNIQNKNIKVTNITGKKLDIRKNKELSGDASHRLGVQVAMSLVVGTNHSGKPLSEKTILKLAEKITTYDNFVRADHHHNMEYYHYGEKHICNYLMGVIDKKELCDIIHNMKYSDQGTVLKATNTILNFMFPNLKKNKDDIGILDNVLSKKRIIKMKTILQDIQMIAQETKRKIEKPNRFSHSDYY